MLKKYSLHNKNVLITGTTGGIGRQLAILLHKNYGCKIFGASRNAEKLEALKSEIPGFLYKVTDVAKKECWESLAAYLKEISFYPDMIINNAGIIHPFDSVLKLSDEEIDGVINTNYKSLIYCARAMLPGLLQSKTPALINVVSAAATLPVPGTSIYSSSKRAALCFTEELSQELSPTGVYVAAVLPGPVKTDLYKTRAQSGENRDKVKDKIISKVGISAKREAELIIKGIKKRKSRIVTGIISKSMGAFYKTVPGFSVAFTGFIMKRLPLKTFKNVYRVKSCGGKENSAAGNKSN